MARCDEQSSGIQTATEKAAVELLSVQGDLDRLARLAAARQLGRWWTLGWWKSLFIGNLPARFADLQQNKDDLAYVLTRLGKDSADLTSARAFATQNAQDEVTALEGRERAAQ